MSCCVCCAVSESHLLPVVNGGSHLKVITRIFCEGPLMKKAGLFLKAQKKKKRHWESVECINPCILLLQSWLLTPIKNSLASTKFASSFSSLNGVSSWICKKFTQCSHSPVPLLEVFLNKETQCKYSSYYRRRYADGLVFVHVLCPGAMEGKRVLHICIDNVVRMESLVPSRTNVPQVQLSI